MNEWWRRLWEDPIRDNRWALGAVLIVGLACFGPVLFMMGRDMFRRRRQETTMSNQGDQVESAPVPAGDERDPQAEVREVGMRDEGVVTESFAAIPPGPWPPVLAMPVPRAVDAEAERRWAAEGIPADPADTIVQSYPQPLIRTAREACKHCEGRGFMPGLNDFLKESIDLLGDRGDEVVRMFYSALLRAHPQLLTLFPGDPTQGEFGTDHKGAIQRDRLLKALLALADLYDPGDPGKMAHLDRALASFGRAHAAFVRQDGTVKGATLEEYAAVKEALFSTLVTVAGQKWLPEYTDAWGQAYDYAASIMLAEQFRSRFAAPRFPGRA